MNILLHSTELHWECLKRLKIYSPCLVPLNTILWTAESISQRKDMEKFIIFCRRRPYFFVIPQRPHVASVENKGRGHFLPESWPLCRVLCLLAATGVAWHSGCVPSPMAPCTAHCNELIPVLYSRLRIRDIQMSHHICVTYQSKTQSWFSFSWIVKSPPSHLRVSQQLSRGIFCFQCAFYKLMIYMNCKVLKTNKKMVQKFYKEQKLFLSKNRHDVTLHTERNLCCSKVHVTI